MLTLTTFYFLKPYATLYKPAQSSTVLNNFPDLSPTSTYNPWPPFTLHAKAVLQEPPVFFFLSQGLLLGTPFSLSPVGVGLGEVDRRLEGNQCGLRMVALGQYRTGVGGQLSAAEGD